MVGILVSTAASAKPLPGGMKVTIKLGRPYIQQGSTTVALRDDDLADYEKILKAELAPDGKSAVVTATRCHGTLAADDTTVSLAKIQARLDNAAGLVALGKKRYGDALPKFASALQKDPETPAYATNVLAAQVLAKKLDLAGQTLAVHGARNPAWFAWQIATDPQLAPIKDHKRARALLAATPGTATVENLGDRDLATTDADSGLVALHTSASVPGAPSTSDIDIVSLTTGKLLARVPLISTEDACDETDQFPCNDAAKARIADHRKVANALLGSLGFTIQTGAWIDVRNGDPVHKDGIAVEFADDAITVTTRSGAEKTLPLEEASTWAIAITAKAVVVKLDRRHILACDDTSARVVGAAIPL